MAGDAGLGSFTLAGLEALGDVRETLVVDAALKRGPVAAQRADLIHPLLVTQA